MIDYKHYSKNGGMHMYCLRENMFPIVVALVLVSIFVSLGTILYYGYQKHQRLLSECLQDRKEYECRAMLQGHLPPTTVIISK